MLPPLDVVDSAGRLLVRTAEGTLTAAVARDGDVTWVWLDGHTYKFEPKRRSLGPESETDDGRLVAQLPGLVIEVMVQAGQSVEKGTKLLVLEAMKTQQAYAARRAGTVKAVHVNPGQQVEEGAVLVEIEP
jgi:3-methylcrotonyl-CoA carboxylase alpha subunit